MKTEKNKNIKFRLILICCVLLFNVFLCDNRDVDCCNIDDYIRECNAEKISQYDDIFRDEVVTLGWDWRMLASIVWNESRFNNDVVSSQGARGLMQFMPRTAARFGLMGDDVVDPRRNIDAGVEYLKFLERRFDEIEDRDERIKFVLAGYNAGPGHVRDAMALAEKYGYDSHVWVGNVEKWLLALQERKYYTDNVCKHGFFRGRYTVQYVRKVFERYEFYKEQGVRSRE